MKALTVWQPWASLIIAGAKPFEFRGWRAPRSMIGQRIVIHAAARKIDRDDAVALYRLRHMRDRSPELAQAWAETCLLADQAEDALCKAFVDDLPMGAGLGTAILGEPRNGLEIAEEFGVPRANDSDRDEHANWGWPMLEIERWPVPIPMRGAQRFWNWPTPDFGDGE
jgi:hypothetical protein